LKIAREGIPLILGFALAGALVSTLALWLAGPWGWIVVGLSTVLTLWCVWFFRDPDRVAPTDPRAVVCPADGVVCMVGRAAAPPELGLDDAGPYDRVCVFMNVFNVHVNRVPCDGVVEKVAYTRGKFFNASLDKASLDNERSAVAMRTGAGHSVIFVQIAGLVARRIICRLRGGDAVRAGERFGLIRFGSRVDVYLPIGTEISVRVGEKTVAGQSVLARLPAPSATGVAGAAPHSPEVALGRR